MKDFTIEQYRKLLETFLAKDLTFQTFIDFLEYPKSGSIILRHDVDLLPDNSLRFAKIQREYGIKGSYYFRAVPESWDEKVICEIAEMGHEVGYHYENLTTTKGDLEKGIQDFRENLKKLRKLVPVSTICMHGSPLSRYDSKDLWKRYDYREFGIVGEPYIDIDFNKVFYLTDTGRRWDGVKVSVRDKVSTIFEQSFNSTKDIIFAVEKEMFPNQVMMNFHPQRWHEDTVMWLKELIFQNLKNTFKRYFFVSEN